MGKEDRGIALITTLILGLIAVVFIGALMYMLTGGTRISGSEKRYYTALEASKGGARQVMTKLVSGEDLTCNGGSTCTPCPTTEKRTCSIDLTLSELGGYNLEAFLLGKEEHASYTVYTIRVKAENSDNPKEKAIIEFVYKIE